MSMGFFFPNQLKQSQKVTLLRNNVYKHRYLNLEKDNLWEFVTCDADGRITSQVGIADLQYSWKMQMQENIFAIGQEDNHTRRIFGSGKYISAAHLHFECAPANLNVALVSRNLDQSV